jgi:hypothetical protein
MSKKACEQDAAKALIFTDPILGHLDTDPRVAFVRTTQKKLMRFQRTISPP